MKRLRFNKRKFKDFTIQRPTKQPEPGFDKPSLLNKVKQDYFKSAKRIVPKDDKSTESKREDPRT